MIGLLGKKVGMTQIFNEDGRQIPVTVLEVGPCYVTALRTKEKHGYNAVQLAFGKVKEKRMTKPLIGQFKKIGVAPRKWQQEIRSENLEGLKVGDTLSAGLFQAGDFVDIEGTSIGKGFQGVVKRHHFKGSASKSHGSMFGRVPGSIGASSFPSRVVKGMRAAGHMGNEQVTIQNLKIMKVDELNHLLAIHGTVPGVENSFLIVRTAIKRGKKNKSNSWKVQGETSADKKASPESPEAKS
ncbi:MAG: 50S ribosomal protein L3 [Candidatus Omnitrophica bacterium]|nr:50S ribosomal protein L3 [Candidatus Omnitrophota bacterium]